MIKLYTFKNGPVFWPTLYYNKEVKLLPLRCFLEQENAQNAIGWGSAMDPAGRAYSTPQTHRLKGLFLRERGSGACF